MEGTGSQDDGMGCYVEHRCIRSFELGRWCLIKVAGLIVVHGIRTGALNGLRD